jgi:hypothetical protein
MLFPTTEDEWKEAGKRITAPLATIQPMSARPTEEWSRLGFRLVIDALTGQVLPFHHLRELYQAAAAGMHDVPAEEIWEKYAELQVAAGLSVLYDLEAVTTEAASAAGTSAE